MNRLLLHVLASIVAFFFFAYPLPSRPDDEIPRIVQRFERLYRSARTLRADFLERYLENGKQVRSDAGVAYFARPGKMRWEYQNPEPNLYLVDGKWSWFFVPGDHTVTRIHAKESSDWRTPLALLAGDVKVSKLCSNVRPDSSTKPLEVKNVVLRCELRGDKPIEGTGVAGPSDYGGRVLFEVSPINGELARILVFDPGGVEVEFRFANWRFGPPLDSKLFRFEPPQGVAIVDGDLMIKGSSAPRNAGGSPTAKSP